MGRAGSDGNKGRKTGRGECAVWGERGRKERKGREERKEKDREEKKLNGEGREKKRKAKKGEAKKGRRREEEFLMPRGASGDWGGEGKMLVAKVRAKVSCMLISLENTLVIRAIRVRVCAWLPSWKWIFHSALFKY